MYLDTAGISVNNFQQKFPFYYRAYIVMFCQSILCDSETTLYGKSSMYKFKLIKRTSNSNLTRKSNKSRSSIGGGLESIRLWKNQRTSSCVSIIQKPLNRSVPTVLSIEMVHLPIKTQNKEEPINPKPQTIQTKRIES